jgi:TatD DNase family protein
MELIDTHCHLTFEQLSNDIEAVLARSVLEDITSWITIGTNPQQNRKAVELADKLKNMYAAVGIHPHDARDVTAETLIELNEFAQDEKVVALSETSLDFHYNRSSQSDQ